MRTAIPLNNFSSGQIDRDLKGRYDIPLTLNGHEIARNFIHSLKGCVTYRSGMKYVDSIEYSALYPFEFNSEQAYLLVFDKKYISFYSYLQQDSKYEFAKVIDNVGNIVQVEHPFGDEIFNLHITQNCDVAYINHIGAKFPEYKLKRTASNQFVLEKTKYTNTGDATLSDVSAETNHGYPGISIFYENRLNRISSSNYPTYIYGSKGGDYDNITTGTESNNGYQFDLAESNSRPYWAISGANSLLVGTPEGVLTVNGGSTTSAITPTNVSAKLSCRDKCSNVRPIRKDNYVFYVSKNKRKLFMFEYDTLMEQFKATCLSKANYEITKGGMSKLALKSDKYDLMYAVCNGKIITICFSNDEGINSWSELNTKGEVIDICAITRPDGDDDLFIEVKRTINGQEKFFLEKLSDLVEFSRYEDFVTIQGTEAKEEKYNYYRYIAEEMRKCNYLDCSIEYSGLQQNKLTYNSEDKTITVEKEIFKDTDIGRRIWIKTITGKEYGIFDISKVINNKTVEVVPYQCSITSADEWYLSATIFSNLEHLEGETVSVVGNGGYLGEFIVKDGKVDISSANTNKVGSAIIGLKYTGMLKSSNLGINLANQGTQTFTGNKNIYKMEFMFSFSGGGKVGQSLYHLEDIQNFNPNGLYDSPALLMDSSDITVLLNGTYEKEKHYYIVQDKPLPMQIDMIVPHYRHVSIT